ncbi:MAG: TIGR00730 family Rossman fold protein [Tunicatimonas sp.]
MKHITVFCASNLGTDPQYEAAARTLGRFLAAQKITLVYGGGRVGLMGTLADAVLAEQGRVIGVIPQFLLDMEVGHLGLTELHVVESLHERKLKMADLCDGVIALPGGFGTLEELIEFITWSQLDLHRKPVGILNVRGYYNLLRQFFDHMVGEGLLKPENRDLAIFEEDIERLYKKMSMFKPPNATEWGTSDSRKT